VTEPTATIANDMYAVRRAISGQILGEGIELGPGPHPFPLDHPGVTVRYVDRWEPEENRALFTELDGYEFVQPDIACNLNTDRLKMIDDESQDFVIASHVLEHMADPLGLLDEIHRVLRPGGIALVLLPDMRRTFDRDRPVTDLDHVVREFEAQVTEVDDDHVDEFLRFTEGDYENTVAALTPGDREQLFELHRQRSIHVHCWAEDDFQPVLDYAIETLGHHWEFVDGILADDEGPEGFEFGYVMRRSEVDLAPEVRVRHFRSTRESWAALRRQVHAVQSALVETQEQLGGTKQALADTRGALAHLDGVLNDTKKALSDRANLGRHLLTDARRVARRAKHELEQRRSAAR
jgi:SAM-dependent methyltransferase